MRESHQQGGGGHGRDSEAAGGTPSMWLPPPGQWPSRAQRQVAFQCLADLQLCISQPADHHPEVVLPTLRATGRQCYQQHQQQPTANPAEPLAGMLAVVHFEFASQSSAGHGRPQRAQQPGPLRFASLLAAPAQRGCEPAQGSARAERAAPSTRWDGKTPVPTPLEKNARGCRMRQAPWPPQPPLLSGTIRQRRAARRRRFWHERLDGACEYAAHLLSGAASAVVSRSVVAPFERIKMEQLLHQHTASTLSVATEILRRDGVAGFWRGNPLNLLRTAPYKAINFASYDAYKLLLQGTDAELGKFKSFLAGALAGVTACITCFPLDLLRTRILADPARHAGVIDTLRLILRTEGPVALYSGCLPALISVAPSNAVFYGVYDLLKARHLARLQLVDGKSHHQLSAVYMLLYGAIAGGAAETAVYPLMVVQRRMQMATVQMVRQGAQPGLIQKRGLAALIAAATGVWKTQGVAGFYTGYVPNILQVLPNAAISYFAYELFKGMIAGTAD